MQFGQQEPKIIEIDPFNATVEVIGATSGGGIDSAYKSSWYNTFNDQMVLHYGKPYTNNLSHFLNGNISEAFLVG
jgi:hypothetical protein